MRHMQFMKIQLEKTGDLVGISGKFIDEMERSCYGRTGTVK